MYSVLNTLSEYTYVYISKNITSYTFLLVFKIVESLQCILKWNVQWNRSVFINETIKEYNQMDKCLTQDCSCLKIRWGLSIFLCQNNNIPIALPLQHLTGKQFFCIYFVFHGITLAKHMVKRRGKWSFLRLTKILNHPTLSIINGIVGEYKDYIINLN